MNGRTDTCYVFWCSLPWKQLIKSAVVTRSRSRNIFLKDFQNIFIIVYLLVACSALNQYLKKHGLIANCILMNKFWYDFNLNTESNTNMKMFLQSYGWHVSNVLCKCFVWMPGLVFKAFINAIKCSTITYYSEQTLCAQIIDFTWHNKQPCQQWHDIGKQRYLRNRIVVVFYTSLNKCQMAKFFRVACSQDINAYTILCEKAVTRY